jgi:hypothetical protein
VAPLAGERPFGTRPVAQPGWERRAIEAVMPRAVAVDMLRLARKLALEAGGRYAVHAGGRVLLWSSERRPDGSRERPVAGFAIAWGVPASGQAAVTEIAWDPRRSSLTEVCRAIALLARADPETVDAD